MNINDVMPKTLMNEDETKKWTSKSIGIILKQLPLVTNFNQTSKQKKDFSIVTWFLLLNNEKIVKELIKNPFFKTAILYIENNKFRSHLERIKNSCQYRTIIDTLLDYPCIFNNDVKTLKLLKNEGLTVNYRLTSSQWNQPLYILNAVKEGLIEFDEEKMCKAENTLHQNVSILAPIMHASNKFLDISQKLEIIYCLREFIKMGANPNITFTDNSQKCLLDWQEYMQLKNPNLYEVYNKILLSEKLEFGLQQKSKNKIMNKL